MTTPSTASWARHGCRTTAAGRSRVGRGSRLPPRAGDRALGRGHGAGRAGPRASRVGAFVDAADGLETAGILLDQRRGGRVRELGRPAAVSGRHERRHHRRDRADGHLRRQRSCRVRPRRAISMEGSPARRPRRRANESADPSDLEPGRYEVVLEPDCVVDVLTFLALYGFNGRAVEEGRSFAKLGEAQFDAVHHPRRRRRAPDVDRHSVRRRGHAEASRRARARRRDDRA